MVEWSKMDGIGGQAPRGALWRQIVELCQQALIEELNHLKPKLTLFATSQDYRSEIEEVLSVSGYARSDLSLPKDGLSLGFSRSDGRLAVITRHPQGWPRTERDSLGSGLITNS